MENRRGKTTKAVVFSTRTARSGSGACVVCQGYRGSGGGLCVAGGGGGGGGSGGGVENAETGYVQFPCQTNKKERD